MKLLAFQTQGNDFSEWIEKGYELPKYNRVQLKQNTSKAPTWLHFGAGNIFRGFPAVCLQELLNEGVYDKGVIVAEGFDYEIIEKAYIPYDAINVLVVLKADGSIEKKVIGSITEALKANQKETEDWKRLEEIVMAPSLQMISFTITEKGYAVKTAKQDYFPHVLKDFEREPQMAEHTMAKVTALLLKRYEQGALPIALVSLDNCSHNGDKVREAILTFAKAWSDRGYVPQSFLNYVKDEKKVACPWSMIDKITPRPDEHVQHILQAEGFEDTELIITQKNTYTAPFVNAEETEYLVIEDTFPNGRPPLDKANILFANRETVDKVERMKVCTCLNPLHTALAIFGCLLDFDTIYKEMQDTDLNKLVTRMGYEEGLPVVVDPGILSPKKFLQDVLEKRLPNPFMPDSPWRIATDTSQKLPIRFGKTIEAYIKQNKKIENLNSIPLVLAGYLRYLMGINDKGEIFTPSADPLLEELRESVAAIKLGDADHDLERIEALLKRKDIFGVDLIEVGLSEKIKSLFKEMIAEKGAVRATLKKITHKQACR